MILKKDFYKRNAEEVAIDLLGCFLVHNTEDGQIIGKIVETEAYLSSGDPASHSFKGRTLRNHSMFNEGGCAYIYYIYGRYYCFNVVTGPIDIGEAVLIRALEPIKGIKLMELRRNTKDKLRLCNGPAKLFMAMGLNPKQDGQSLESNELYIKKEDFIDLDKIYKSKRIGVRDESLKLRFYLNNSTYVSGSSNFNKMNGEKVIYQQ